MIYGYARCSTNEERQDINRQKRNCIHWASQMKSVFTGNMRAE